ncbi:MAG: hypothetical protein HY748_02290 [Elusimicrobia bacterium]|nr:hypothetical protein [Elusimicrobiota bacterium]
MLWWAASSLAVVLPRFLLASEVVGFFKTGSGRQAFVTAENRAGLGPVEITLDVAGSTVAIRIAGSRWRLDGEKVAVSSDRLTDFAGGHVGISMREGTFVIPPFGAKFVVSDSQEAAIMFVPKAGGKRRIRLPIRGGEIKAFSVLPSGLEFLIYERNSKFAVSKDGRRLFGLASTGENILVSVRPRGKPSVRRLSSSDPKVFWVEGDRFFRVDRRGLRLEPAAGN